MNILIFDTETIGKVSQDLINVGYKIVDVNIQAGTFTTLVERDYIVGSLYNNTVYCMNDDFVGATKYGMFTEALESKKAIKRSIKQIFKTLENDLKRHKVLFGYAYNCAFDVDKFKRTSETLGIENPIQNLPIFDIWAYSYAYICNTEDYKQWAKDNAVYTDSEKYIPTSVESVCKYLYKNLDFVEDHTALSDVQHETYILMECVKRGCDITRGMERAKLIPSGKVFNEVLVLPDGQEVSFEYTKAYKRGDKTTYKM